MFKIILNLGINKSTRATFCFGTPQTTPPEIIKRTKYDQRSDLWSFGVVLYQLANLELPFKEENIPKLYKAILKKEPKWMKNEYLSGSI